MKSSRRNEKIIVALLVFFLVIGSGVYASQNKEEGEGLQRQEATRLSHLSYNISYMEKYASEYYESLKAGKKNEAEATLISWQHHLDATNRFIKGKDQAAKEAIERLATSLEFNLQIYSLDRHFPSWMYKFIQESNLAFPSKFDEAEAKLLEFNRNLVRLKVGEINEVKVKVLDYFLGIEEELKRFLVCRKEYIGQLHLIHELVDKIKKQNYPAALKVNSKLIIALNEIKEKIPKQYYYFFQLLESKIHFLEMQRERLEKYHYFHFGESMAA